MQNLKVFLQKAVGLLARKWSSRDKRPNVLIKLPLLYKIIETLDLLVVVALCVYTIYIFPELPDTIPAHFTWDGSADDWRSKYFIFLELFLLIAVFGLLSYLSKFYRFYNYPVEITAENAESQYSLTLKFFIILKTLNVMLFTYVHSVILSGAKDPSQSTLGWVFWILITMICSSTFVYNKIALKIANINIKSPRSKIE